MHTNQHRLGQLIRQGVVIFPNAERHGITMSDDLKDLITKLLEKNVETRLGSTNDADEIVSHKFFQGVDWDRLMKKEIPAPFKPDLEFIKNKKSDSIEKDPSHDQNA